MECRRKRNFFVSAELGAFKIELETCQHCGHAVNVIAGIEDPVGSPLARSAERTRAPDSPFKVSTTGRLEYEALGVS